MVESTANHEDKLKRIRPPESGAPFNAVEDIIYRRRSVRYYLEKQVPDYLLRRILEAGRFAPSAGNAQPWKFIVVQDKKMIAEMEEQVLKVCGWVKRFADYLGPGNKHKEWRARMLMRLNPNNFHPFPFAAMKVMAEGNLSPWHGAPTVLILLADKRSPGNPSLDVGIAGQNMVLTAHSLGLGTCWVSFVTPLSMFPKWRKRLGIRYPYTLVSSIALGYPRGIPDGYVTRETHAIDWFSEDGTFKVVY